MSASPTVCVFEDEKNEAFLPIAYMRPVFDLLCGTMSLFRKIAAVYPGCAHRQLCRPYLTRAAASHETPSLVGGGRDRRSPSERVLFINGRILASDSLADEISPEGEDELFVSGDDLIAARLSGPRLTMATKWLAEQDSRSVVASFARELPVRRVDITTLNFVWDLIRHNGDQIVADFQRIPRTGERGIIHPAATVYEPDNVWVAPTAEVMAGVVIDARSGPIVVEKGARIEPFSLIQGPAFIGPHSRIVTGRIREFTTIGPYCRVGGEVECCIFQGYSNKYHDGFTGHSYFGEWVNIGALTTTSDLKNTRNHSR
jgi:UDP-N-acetylglucosamine diphosphorylase/glucosamine-1-phosphate N-acetyltransferase